MRLLASLLICTQLVGCVHVASTVTPDHFLTPEPTATVEAAVAAAPPLLDESSIINLPYQPPQGLTLRQPAPFSGILVSEYDAARYRLLDASADRWRTEAVAAQWQLARTERQDAVLQHTLERRVDVLARQAARRHRWTWIGIGMGLVVGGFIGFETGRALH